MIKILELFGGIGACSKALERLGIDYEIADYVEIDKYAVKSFNAIHNTNFEPQDICEWNKDIDVDLIMHGSPCQDFSLAGLQAGGDEGSGTRSSLMYETIRIVEKLKPKYVIWENVKNVISKKHKHNYDNYCNKMSELGYNNYGKVLNAKDYGIPQNRERVFTISIRKDIDTGYTFPEPIPLKLRLKDFLEDNVDEKYYLSDKMINYVCSRMPLGEHHITTGIHIENKNSENLAGTICTEPGNKPSDNYIIDNDNITYSKEIGYLVDGTIVKKDTENYIEWEEKGKLDIDCRAYKDDKISGAIVTSNKNKVVTIGNYMPSNHNASRIVDNEGLAPTVMENHGTVTATNANNLRIRKLIPLETWRLMGFDREDFIKAEKVNSNTQLYKQAGNSIVVNVLEAILKNLLLEDNNEIKGQISIFDLMEDQ